MARVDALEDFASDAERRLRIVERNAPTPEEKRDLEQRIRALESARWTAAGATAVLTFLASIAGAFLAKYLGS